MSITLIENRGENLNYVNQVLALKGIPATKENNNENVAILKETDTGKVIGIVGFNSDSGRDYHEGNIIVNHEILYLADYTKVTTNSVFTEAIKKLVSEWVLNYLIRRAVCSSKPLGTPNVKLSFDVGINRLADKNNLLEDCFNLIEQSLDSILEPLGYKL